MKTIKIGKPSPQASSADRSGMCVTSVIGWLVQAIAVAVLAADAQAQGVFASGSTDQDGPLRFTSPPSKRFGHAMVYDSARQRVVLFGGEAEFEGVNQAASDTWEWDGLNWTRRFTPNSPPARVYHAMAFDSARNVVVLFGGSVNNTTLNDTWEYDGNDWRRIITASVPAARHRHALAYDIARQESVLFGGGLQNSRSKETWAWNGSVWTQRSTSAGPDDRYDHAMAYDPARQRVVLYGGFTTGFEDRGDTWEWNGSVWSRRLPDHSPGDRYRHSMTYDVLRQRVVLFAGYKNSGSLAGDPIFNDLWEWDGNDWVERPVSPLPPHRWFSSIAPTASLGHLMVFGGRQQGGAPSQDSWIFDSHSWLPQPIIDLSQRRDAIWHHTSIDIASGVTLHFLRNDANTSPVLLASGNITIAGDVDLDGEAADSAVGPGAEAKGGPGGFPGGLGSGIADAPATAGAGPGGGLAGSSSGEAGGNAGHASSGGSPTARAGSVYGNRLLRPLVGGSGGGGGAASASARGGNGGGGGGAILLASSGTIRIDGTIHANGGAGADVSGGASDGGAGSGGTIRLVANKIEGSGTLTAKNGANHASNGLGRIRTEAFVVNFAGSTPSAAIAPPLGLSLGAQESVSIVSVAGQGVRMPPHGDTSDADVIFTESGPVTIGLRTTGIPAGTQLRVRVTTSGGQVLSATSTPTDNIGNASATMTVPAGVGTIQASADYLPSAP